jgi:hypothetical protein
VTDPRDQLPEGDVGPWIATFRDGPLADHEHDRVFSVGPIWRSIVLVQLPRDPHQPMNPWHNRWTIVAGDGIGELDTPRVPWEGEVSYRLADVIPMAGMDGEPVAYYEVEGE